MSTYAIYKYDLRQSDTSRLKPLKQAQAHEPEHEKPMQLSQAQEIVGRIFMEGAQRALPIEREIRNETFLLDNEVKRICTDVVVLTVNNVKIMKYQEEREERELATHPGCYVIIDNRPGVAQMLIERSPAFDSNPSQLAALLQDAMNRKLAPYHLEIEIRQKIHEASFWEMVTHQMKKAGDPIREVTFHLQSPTRVAGIDASDEMKKQLEMMTRLGSILSNSRQDFSVVADKQNSLQLDRTEEDLAQLVALCNTNAFSIDVQFRHYGLYRSDAGEKAMMSLPDETVKNFIDQVAWGDGEEEEIYELVAQLNVARNLTEDGDALPVKRRRKRAAAE